MRSRNNGSRYRPKNSDGYSGIQEKKYLSDIGVRSELKPEVQKRQDDSASTGRIDKSSDTKE